MDFAYPPEAEAFRARLREWFEDNLEPRFRNLTEGGDDTAERLALLREWNAKLADAGYAAIQWPSQYGGQDAGLIEQVVLAEENHRAGAPPTVNPIGIANIAPAIMKHGSEEQRERFLLRMLRGDDIWCQGFSEPGAGSDLASLSTRAIDQGEHWVVNGQKVWNTFGAHADWCEMLVRTTPSERKHSGISCLLVDMRLPGIEVRPTTTITGDSEFAEIFLHDVEVPKQALLGEVDEGWAVAMTTLTSERAGVATMHLRVNGRIRELIEAVRELDGGFDARKREKLARLYLHGQLLERLSGRALSGILHGRMGPEGSLVKLVWSKVEQSLGDVAAEVLGAEALGGRWARARLSARSFSIAGGTTQVNKNIVAQRVLGLPRGT
ncbi:MAG: acyl-CoA dehydrogenase family protein [Deltaproteobacteria bacterium]|nr:acyl-CoA dehydrogenase family protein [Deltaproteobacteria bacterium]